MLGPVQGESAAVVEGVTLKSDRGDVNGIIREVEVRLFAAAWADYVRRRTFHAYVPATSIRLTCLGNGSILS